MPVRTGSQPPRLLRDRPAAPGAVPARDASDAALFPEGEMKLHHERDESPAVGHSPDPASGRAYRDASGPQCDTDVRGSAVAVFERATGTPSRAGTDAGRNPPRRRRGRRN